MSKNPAKKSEVISRRNRKAMVRLIMKGIKSFPRRNVSEDLVTFAERKRVLVSGTSRRPGPYRYAVTPYLREIAYEASESTKTTELAVQKPTQWGFTDGVMMNHELYCIEYGIGPVLYVTSDDDLAGEHVDKRIDPMISAAGMQHYITPPVQKRSNKSTGDTKRAKSFGGTFLRAIGARSESKLSSTPIRVLHLDEEDKYPVKLAGGGDSTEKAKRRTDSYGNLKKIIHGSTPKEKATSRIEPIVELGDMRFYHIPCPKCGHMQRILWSQIKWDKNEHGKIDLHFDDDGGLLNNPVWLECSSKECDYKMRDYEKVDFMMEEGYGGHAKWIPSKKTQIPGLKSWRGHGLEGFRSWVDIVIQWEAIDGDDNLRQDMINDVFGETYEQKIDKPSEHYLASRAEQDWTRGQVNDKVKILNSGWDIQGGKNSRVEGAVMGWNVRKESWAIDYHIFPGNTSDPYDPCWDKMEEVIMRDYYKQDGSKIKMTNAFIDARFETESVKNFCERFPYSANSYKGVFPVYGKKSQSEIVKQHPGTIATPEVFMDDQKLKKEIYMHLKKKVPATGHNVPNGYIHFPSDYSEEYYKQMVAEDITEITDSKGIQTEIIIHNPHQRRNETLDCTKMALAGLYYIYLTFFKLWNKKRKNMRRKEVNPDWQLFWSKQGIDANEESVMEESEP